MRFSQLVLLGTFLCSSVVLADNWPQWRGPAGDGVSQEKGLPIAWDEESAVKWKCDLPEWGNSTPVIWEDAIFLTSQENDERLLLLKINKQTGKIEWTREVGTAKTPRPRGDVKWDKSRGHQKFDLTHNLASPSPVTDGEVVIVHFGNGDLAAYDFDGNQLWKRNLQDDLGQYTIWWGHANSPVLWKHLVISVCMQDSLADLEETEKPAVSYVVAHDKRTGRQRWLKMRSTEAMSEPCDSYVTPLLRNNAGQTEVVVMGGLVLDAYRPVDGERLWYLPGLVGNRTITGPVTAHDMIYITQGMKRAMLAVKPGGDGERTRDDVVWSLDQGTPDSPTPVVWGELLYLVSNNGIARCLDAHTGQLQWKARLDGDYRASPLAAEGRVYFLNTKGLTTVVSASSRLDKLTENQLDDTTFASPVTSDGMLFIRGHKRLYCLRP